jgi:hypothetical protein
MAILPNQLGVRVYITDNDGTLPEYDDDDDEPAEPNTTTKYIEAVSDSRFEIRFAFSHPFPTQYGVHVIFYLDGVRVRSRTLKVTELLGTGGREKKHSCRRTHFRKDGINYAQNFQFSKLVTGMQPWFFGDTFGYSCCYLDEDSDQLLGADTARALDQTGQITVKLYYVHNVQERSGRPGGPAKCLHHFDRLPEKAMKGKTLSHSIR